MGFPAQVAAATGGPVVALYIASQRRRLEDMARPLTPSLRQAMVHHFDTELLESARLFVAETLPLPPVLLKLPGVPSPAAIGGITYDHIIATRHTPDPAFLFHELVHVVQYRLLGVSRFARMYLRGYLESGSYDQIPLERCAYDLEWRYRAGGLFSVEAAVKEWLSTKGNGGSSSRRFRHSDS